MSSAGVLGVAGRSYDQARRRAREGVLLPLRPLRVRQAGRARALHAKRATEYIGKPDDYGQQKRDEYTQNDYHKVATGETRLGPSGAVEDLQALFEVGYRVAQTDRWPEWKPGTEFKAKRDSMLKGDKP